MIASALAIKPTTPQVTTGGLQIEVPKVTYYQWLNTSNRLNFHVVNSTGWNVVSNTTNCTLHIYDHSGHHIIDQRLNPSSDHSSDYQFDMGLNITNYEGFYAYVVYCTTTSYGSEAGFTASDFIIKKSEPVEDSSVYSFFAFVMGIILFCMLYVGLTLSNEHYPLKLFFIWVAILILVPISQLMVLVADQQLLSNLSTILQLVNYLTIIISIVATAYFVIYITKTMLMTVSNLTNRNPLKKNEI